MLPVVANTTVYNPIQTPLVNTPLPGSATARVPYDNVAPSVSNAQVNNNARGNSAVALPAEQAPVTSSVAAATQFSLPANSQNLNVTAQATFLAQLAGSDLSPEAQSILIQYEKMIVFSNVKYKPSNAGKPSPPPPGVFGRIIQQAQSTPRVQASVPSPAAQVATGAVQSNTAPVARPQVAEAPRPSRAETASKSPPASSVAEDVVPTAQAISAYAATARRGGSGGNITDSV